MAKSGSARRDLMAAGGGVSAAPAAAPAGGLERALRDELNRLIDGFHRGVTPPVQRVLALGLMLDIGQHELAAMLKGPVLATGKHAALEAFRASSGTVAPEQVEAAWAACHASIKVFRSLEKRVQQTINALEQQAYLPAWNKVRERHHKGDGAAHRAAGAGN